jgi:hypothetical protein
MGFDAQVLTTGEVVTKRTTEVQKRQENVGALEKRISLWPSFNILAMLDAARAAQLLAGQQPKPMCNAGSMKLNAVMNTKNNAVIGGKLIPLFNEDNRFGSQW